MATALKTCTAENKLFYEYRATGDKRIRDELVNSYIYIAEVLSKKFINRGIEYDDIFQMACMGIMYAVERFDPDRGVCFATYATPTVLGEIRHYFRDRGNFIKVPRKLYEIFFRAEQVKRHSKENISVDELSRILDIPREDIIRAYTIGDAAFIKSLEDEAYADGNLTLSNLLGVDDNNFIMIENRDFVEYCMGKLTEREAEFVRLRYYDELSQIQIAKKWDKSQMYVSRMERKVLKKIRNMLFSAE